MTPQQIRDAVTADPALLAAVKAENPDWAAIAAQVAAGKTRAREMEVGNGTIIETIGMTVGNALLDVLMSSDPASPYRHIKPLLEQGRLKAHSPLIAGALVPLVGVVPGFTATHCDMLINLGKQPEVVSVHELTSAVFNTDGTYAV
jgi:hypothetical protein